VKHRTIRERIASGFVPALKAAIGVRAKRTGGPVHPLDPLPLPSDRKDSSPAVAVGEISGDGRDLLPSTPRKPVRQATLAVKDGFKEF
jgi:hypothetical protein